MLGLRNAPKIDTATSTAEVVYGTPLRVPGLCFQDVQSPRQTAAEQLDLSRANVAAYSPEALDLRRFKSSPFIAKTLRTAAYVYVRDDRLGRASLSQEVYGPFQGHKQRLEQQHISFGLRQEAGFCIAGATQGGCLATGRNMKVHPGFVLGEECCTASSAWSQDGDWGEKRWRSDIVYFMTDLLIRVFILILWSLPRFPKNILVWGRTQQSHMAGVFFPWKNFHPRGIIFPEGKFPLPSLRSGREIALWKYDSPLVEIFSTGRKHQPCGKYIFHVAAERFLLSIAF